MVLRENVAILCAFLLSILLHLLVLPIVYTKKPPMAYLPPAKATHLETPITEKPEIELGIDKSKESTLTWIGYEEYEEQRARFANVEQAEMKADIEHANPNQVVAVSTAIQEISKPFSEFTSQFLEMLRGIEITTPSKEIVEVEQEETPETPQLQVEIEEIPADGNPSDRDSEATSVFNITSDQWKKGKPLASQGIVLRPRIPIFTANQLVTNAPSDLVAELHIGALGKPNRVVIVYSTGSGSIDRTLEASLYRWRASGDKIDELEGEETVNITIHITFAK
ncbi:hypothetical protein H8D99_00290 [bacterium]|nr:hypothetical protein [bacterium]